MNIEEDDACTEVIRWFNVTEAESLFSSSTGHRFVPVRLVIVFRTFEETRAPEETETTWRAEVIGPILCKDGQMGKRTTYERYYGNHASTPQWLSDLVTKLLDRAARVVSK